MTKLQKYQKAILDFNEKHPVGTSVLVKMDSGTTKKTKTRSKAELLSGHTAVIWLDDICGCYTLERVTPYEN